MRRFITAGFLTLIVALFAGCSDRDSTSPAEPTFGKKPASECLTDDQQALSDDILLDIGDLFADRKTRNAAEEHINNIGRKLCKNQYEDAVNMAWDFLYFTNNKIPEKFTGDAQDAAELTSKVFRLASDPATVEDPLEIPGGAFLPTGGVVTFDPADATPEIPIVAATSNGEAAVVIDNPDAFPPGTGMVTIALSREFDDEVELPGEFIPGFQAHPEGYRILSSHEPSLTGGGVLIALCELLPSPGTRVIGWLHEGNVELLVPTDPNPEDLGYIDCADASPYSGSTVVTGTPNWLNFARRIVRPVTRLFEPKSLNAMFFKGRGLGGRTTSLSVGAPVDPVIKVGETVQLSVGTAATWSSDDIGVATVDVTTGLVTGVSPGTAVITAEFGAETLTFTITVEAVLATLPHALTFSSGTDDASTEIYTLDESLARVQLTDNAALDFLPGWSPAGSQIVFSSERTGDLDIWIMNLDGSGAHNLTQSPTSQETGPDWSAMGGRIAYTSFSSSPVERDIWIVNGDGTGATNLTNSTSDDVGPSWSPDGTKIAFFSDRDGDYDIYVMNSDGTSVVQLTNDPQTDATPDWSPDGTEIAFSRLTPGSDGDIWVMNTDGTGQTNLTNSAMLDYAPDWSPDGLYIAFDRFPDVGVNSSDIWIMAADGSGQAGVVVGPEDERSPAWRPAAGPSLACYPGLPDPVLVFDSLVASTYYLNLANAASFSDDMFSLTPDYGPCGGNPTPSRTWLRFYLSSGSLYYTHCGYEQAADLSDVRSIVPPGPTPPNVYVTLEDRACGQTYTSNTVVMPPQPLPPQPPQLLTVTGAGPLAGSIIGPGINCQWNGSVNSGDCTEVVPAGTVVTLIANPPGVFWNWSPNCTPGDAVNTCQITVNQPETVVANFIQTPV
jgi:Tol biopolymer transport system component